VSHFVYPGSDCRLALSALAKVWAGGFDGTPEISEEIAKRAYVKERGPSWGSPIWVAKLWSPGDPCIEGDGGAVAGEGWVRKLQTTHMRPEASQLLQAFSLWFGCNPDEEQKGTCGHAACPYCWHGGPNLLLHNEMQCSINYRGGPPVSNSGLGRLRGENVRAAVNGPPMHGLLVMGREKMWRYSEIHEQWRSTAKRPTVTSTLKT